MKSFAHVMSAVKSSPISSEITHVMKPIQKGFYLTVAVDEGLHKNGVLELRDSLIGRIIHACGDKPLSQDELTKKLGSMCGLRTPWKLIPIGKDSDLGAAIGILESSHHNGIGLGRGSVIKLDECTTSHSMGHFARVLVELDLKHDREEYVMFKRASHRSVVYIQYERLPEFYTYCNVIGHSTGNCSPSYNSKQGKGKQVPSKAPKVVPKPDHPAGGTKQ
ncbi:hypothetical protein ACS0TY_034512 [Phlomoides rotata]